MSSFPQNHARSRLTWADRRPSRADLFLGIYSYIVKTCGSIDAESSVGSGAYGSKSRSAVSLTNVVTHAEYERIDGVTIAILMEQLMDVLPIRTDEDHRTALAAIDACWGAPEGDTLDVLVALVEIYEAKRWPIEVSGAL
jgi:hypothetical protein